MTGLWAIVNPFQIARSLWYSIVKTISVCSFASDGDLHRIAIGHNGEVFVGKGRSNRVQVCPFFFFSLA